MSRTRTPFEKTRWYIGITAAAGLVTAVVVAVTHVKDLVSPALTPTTYTENIEVILDSSAHMNEPFAGVSRLQAAVQAVGNFLATQPSATSTEHPANIAFRQFGGACEDSSLVVNFSPANKDRIREAAARVTARGKANVAYAVLAAINDFNDAARFRGVNKRIVVITGSDDECLAGASAIEEIRNRVSTAKPDDQVALDFHFIGLALTDAEQKRVSDLAASVKGRAAFVTRRDDLERELASVMVPAGSAAEVKRLLESINGVATNLKVMVARIQAGDYAAAKASLGEARMQFDQSAARVSQVADEKDGDATLKALRQMVSDNRALQSRLLTIAERMLPQASAGNIEAYNASAKEYTEIVKEYGDRTTAIDNLAAELSGP